MLHTLEKHREFLVPHRSSRSTCGARSAAAAAAHPPSRSRVAATSGRWRRRRRPRGARRPPHRMSICDPASCDAGLSCGYCLQLLPTCPDPASISAHQGLQGCEPGDVSRGEICEGSGACGTSDEANNCQCLAISASNAGLSRLCSRLSRSSLTLRSFLQVRTASLAPSG